MCLTFFYINPDPSDGSYNFILIFNRDEFYNRPTAHAAWKDGILAGRDEHPGREGGTWLAINTEGKIGFLTNIYTGVAVQGKGRGFLIQDFLNGSDSAQIFLETLSKSSDDYSPFNLCTLELGKDQKTYNGFSYTRSREGCEVQSEGPNPLAQGCTGLGNHPLSAPYKKTCVGKREFEGIVGKMNEVGKKDELEKKLFELMGRRGSNLPDPQMELQGSKSSVKNYHDKLSSIFVEMSDKNYGTRMQTLILVDFQLNVTFVEKSRTQNGEWEEARFEFKISE